MDIVIELLKEYGIYLLINIGIFLSVFLGRPKTAEKLEKIKAKRQEKLAKKGAKLAEKATEIYNQLNDEVEKNG